MSLMLHAFIIFREIPKPAVKKKPKTHAIKKIKIKLKLKQLSKVKIKLKQKKSNKKRGSHKDSELFVETIIENMFKELRLKRKNKGIMSNMLKKDCKKSFIGIGIVYDRYFYKILSVGVGTPADIAGFKVGDILIDPRIKIKNKYSIGTLITVPVDRNGIIIHIQVTVGKICST